ncbi:MAG: FkbM family methyltransferase [Thiohalomonadaceae bacterium]
MRLIEGFRKTGIVLGHFLRYPKLMRKLQGFVYKGYLLDEGWINSAKHKRPLAADGSPLPWFTYPMIDFLGERLNHEMKVFEYGGGNSTLYFASRVAQVTTVEHNAEWHDYLVRRMPENCKVLFQPLEYGGAYSQSAKTQGELFDLIVVDGRDRVNCARHALDALSARGVIIFDDFERERYHEAEGFLRERNFRRLNFWGIKPGLMERVNTALFYRDGNVFGL